MGQQSDDRASACLDALTSKSWGFQALEAILTTGYVPAADKDISILMRAVSLDAGDPERVVAAAAALRDAGRELQAVAGSDAETSRQLSHLLEVALAFHGRHGDGDCPVCGTTGGLTQSWAESTRLEIERLRRIASGSDHAHRAAEAARRKACELLTGPPGLLKQLFAVGLDGLADAQEQWEAWHCGASITDPASLATHLETHFDAFARAIDTLRRSAAAEVQRREDRWRPIATAISEWIPTAKAARSGAEHLPRIKAAENWLKDASAEVRNQRFAPIAEKAMTAWRDLRQQSNVELGRIELLGSKAQRRVTLDVTVDGVQGAALGVMSQGELHSLALSLFLPRATLPESPFRFVVIDAPVQSMDPARVDGLARALEDTARSRQVIVFTHDERLPESTRRLGIDARVIEVARRENSQIDLMTGSDPTERNLEDAEAIASDREVPPELARQVVPGYCRAAIEAAS